ncbi:hypothetical protein PsorP6_010928 [Peronosclerospora sorghi]|uniref:Uncharacterized protein n=1 Tax=Peronosclerospora sorghi TaxID=230839 RepID=A0ACC0VVT2_9STRA|nr:hypothetical protein PsorP6_010928 [Peronosclerospora sorghi]
MACIRNRYRIVRQLTPTTYGGVYLCHDEWVRSRRVVLKCVSLVHAIRMLERHRPELQSPDDPRQEKAFARFQRAWGEKQHPHLVQYLDDFIEGPTLWFVLEYCTGGDLYSSVNRGENRRLDCTETLAIIHQVAHGVAHLHAHGIAHRDLSLENILVHRGVCKIGDFGLSTRTNELCRERVGKEYYMAPEVVAPHVPYDPKAADMWSLGIIFFILVTGSPLVPLASDEDAAFRAFKKVGVRAVLRAWGMDELLEEHTMQLVEGLLQWDPTTRLSIEQVVTHDALKQRPPRRCLV